MTTSDERRWQALEKLYDFTGDTVDFVDIIGHQPDEHEGQHWRHTFRALDREGLINYYGTIDGGGSVEITDPGRAKVEERRRLRVSPAEMRSGAERGILQYLHGEDRNGTTMTDLQGDDGLRVNLAGAILPSELIGRVAEDLKEAGLIEGGAYVAEYEGPFTARLTRLGIRCIESGKSVDEFLDQQKSGRPSHVVNIGTVSGGNLNWGDHVTQNATTTTGLVADEVRQLVQSIVQALPALGLSEESADAVRRDAAVIEGELQRQTPESPGIVRSMMKRTLDTIQTEGSNQLAVYLVTTAKNLLSNVGIDLG